MTMTQDIGLILDYQPLGRNGQVRLTARFADGTSHTDKIDVATSKERERFIRAVVKGRKGLDKNALSANLDRVAAEIVAKPQEDDDASGGEGKKRPSQADILVKIAEGAELFHTPGGHDSEGYATVIVNGHAETWPIASKGFKRWLGKLFFDMTQKAPSSQAIQDAVNVIAGRAVHEGQEKPVAIRLARTDEGIFLDLADEQWRVVHITSAGWRVANEAPVKFVRKRGMFALPAPDIGGSISHLRDLVNLPNDDAWKLFVGWLVMAFCPDQPFPVLVVNGEQGSAKSTLCRVARALIDPNIAPLRRPPRDDRDLMIAATNGWIVGFDNLSSLPAWLSDSLCMLATGGGFATRELYTDSDEKLFDATRPIMVNGIEDLATRSDLLDRAVTLTLPTIPDDQRRDEKELWNTFERLRPLILGAILDAVVMAIRNRPTTKLATKPRMADFALWIVAAEPALGWAKGDFLAAYNTNRGAANSLALESSIIGPPVLALMDKDELWQGTAKDLLAEIERNTDDKTKKRKEWPTSPRKLAGELRRLAPNLRREGIDVTFGTRGNRGISITIERAGKTSSRPTPPTSDSSGTENCGEDSSRRLTSLTPRSAPQIPGAGRVDEQGDEGVDVLPLQSDASISEGEVMEWTG